MQAALPLAYTKFRKILPAENDIQGVHFITGDLHACHAIYAELSGPAGKTVPLWEYCSSAFNQQPN